MLNSFFGDLIAAIVGVATCLYFYITTGFEVLFYLSDIIAILTVVHVTYHYRGIICKERIKNLGRIVCSRCKGFYFGLGLSIVASILLVYFKGIPCFRFGESIALMIFALLLGAPTMSQGYIRRSTGETRDGFFVPFFGFLVGAATILSFLAFNSFFGCRI